MIISNIKRDNKTIDMIHKILIEEKKPNTTIEYCQELYYAITTDDSIKTGYMLFMFERPQLKNVILSFMQLPDETHELNRIRLILETKEMKNLTSFELFVFLLNIKDDINQLTDDEILYLLLKV